MNDIKIFIEIALELNGPKYLMIYSLFIIIYCAEGEGDIPSEGLVKVRVGPT